VAMRAFVVRRLLQMIVTLWVILTLIFVMFRMLPADPASLLIDQNLTRDARADLLRQWGLDQPLHIQYVRYLANIIRGNFGISFSYHRPVFEIMGPFIVNSVVLMLPAILLAILIAVAGGAYMGWHRGTRLEKVGVVTSLFFHSVPVYWIAIVLVIVFGYWLRWFPTGNIRTPGYLGDTFLQKFLTLDFAHHLALPLLTSVLFLMTNPMMLMRSAMIEVQGEDFLELLRAKGLPERQLIIHAARNALLPVVTYLALMSTLAVGGSVLLETVFAWPGMGREIVRATASLDYPMAQAAFFVWSAAIVVMNLVADLLYGWLDPRIAYR
ncbi:MAG: ABC transporter permease, partial [Armatimonadota bacterium]